MFIYLLTESYIVNAEKKKDSITKELERNEKEMRKTVKMINDLAHSYLTEAAILFLEDKLEKEFNIKANITSIEFEKRADFDLFTELGDKLILGKVRRKATLNTLKSLERSTEKLLEAKPEFRKKKIILIIYAKKATEQLIVECKRKGIYLTLGYAEDFTPLKL